MAHGVLPLKVNYLAPRLSVPSMSPRESSISAMQYAYVADLAAPWRGVTQPESLAEEQESPGTAIRIAAEPPRQLPSAGGAQAPWRAAAG